MIIYHDTAGSAVSAISWFQNPAAQVSSHYIVGRDGAIYRVVPEDKAAWHAGRSTAFGWENLNDWSIGIEIEDISDQDPYPDAQMEAILDLAEDISLRYAIPLNHHLGHSHIAVPRGRKVDPGRDYPWFDYLNVLGARLSVASWPLRS